MTPGPGPVLVTGAAGFIGARFVESCNARGERVLSVDETEYFARPEHAGIDFGTVVDPDGLVDGIEADAYHPRAIVHLGACTDTTELDVALLRRRNLEYSRGLWRFAAARGIPFVYASSAATYGAGENGWDDDEAMLPRLLPLNPYGRSKHDFDRWALQREQAGESPPSWSGFKFFNVYGFGERHKGRMASVVLQAFDQIQSAGRVWLFRSHRDDIQDGHQKRDFVFVDDVIDVLRFALDKPIRRGLFNLGTGEARTFLDLAHATFAAMGLEPAIDFIDTPADIRPRYQYFTEANVEKLRAEGFVRPFTSLEVGVARTVERLRAAERTASDRLRSADARAARGRRSD